MNNEVKRSKEYTEKTKELSATCRLSRWQKKLGIVAVQIMLDDKRIYHLPDKPGCEKLKVRAIENGWNLNYPRTLKVIIKNDTVKPALGLSGAVYDVSEVEYEFVRDVLHRWEEVQRSILASEHITDYNTSLLLLTDRKDFWVNPSEDPSEINRKAKVVIALSETLKVPVMTLIVELERKICEVYSEGLM